MAELTMAEIGYKKHLKVELFPTIWCPGCGIGTIMMQLLMPMVVKPPWPNSSACKNTATGMATGQLVCRLVLAHDLGADPAPLGHRQARLLGPGPHGGAA